MTRATFLSTGVFLMAAARIWAAEPIAGNWLLKTQDVGTQKTNPDPLLLRIVPSGTSFEFSYSLPVNNVQFVSMKFVSKLDGAEAPVLNANGAAIGTIAITKAANSQYKVLLQGPNRPSSTGTMTVSKDSKTLVSESDSSNPNGARVHTVQTFERQLP